MTTIYLFCNGFSVENRPLYNVLKQFQKIHVFKKRSVFEKPPKVPRPSEGGCLANAIQVAVLRWRGVEFHAEIITHNKTKDVGLVQKDRIV